MITTDIQCSTYVPLRPFQIIFSLKIRKCKYLNKGNIACSQATWFFTVLIVPWAKWSDDLKKSISLLSLWKYCSLIAILLSPKLINYASCINYDCFTLPLLLTGQQHIKFIDLDTLLYRITFPIIWTVSLTYT